MNAHESILQQAFESWGLPPEAVLFLLKVWSAAQFLDDVKDGHPPTHLNRDIYTLAVGLPADEFLAQHRVVLSGMMATVYYKWQAANAVEAAKDEEHLDKAYAWRAGYYDLVLLVVALCKPREECERIAVDVMKLYGERREEYLEEIRNA